MPIFRRRSFPRRRRPLPPGWRHPRDLPPAARKALRRLKRANELMAHGQAAQAAAIFDKLAEDASKHGIPRAPQLYLQAGRAWIEAGEVEKSIQRLQTGLILMGRMGQFRRLPVVSHRVLTEMRNLGLTEQAEAIEDEIQGILATHGLSLATAFSPGRQPSLPAKCNYCGGNVMPNEADWIDEHHASCVYCGSILDATS